MKLLLSLITAMLLIPSAVDGQTATRKSSGAMPHHHVIVDLTTVISDGWALTLSNVEGLKRNFKDDAEIEVIVHGPAVSMLHRDDADFAVRIRKLHEAGVRFVVGTSTLDSSNATKADMFPFVEYVPSATAEIVLKQEAGWSYLKGGY
jgi:intracellular sulfur oxidation DsrE/DsrF family protein